MGKEIVFGTWASASSGLYLQIPLQKAVIGFIYTNYEFKTVITESWVSLFKNL